MAGVPEVTNSIRYTSEKLAAKAELGRLAVAPQVENPGTEFKYVDWYYPYEDIPPFKASTPPIVPRRWK